MRATVLGAAGFIGSHLAAALRRDGHDVATPARDERLDGPLGVVFDCAGITGDYRTRPWDTVEGHVTRLAPLLRGGDLTSYVYLSSTRVYKRSGSTREVDPVPVASHDPEDLYDLSKLLGECLALRTCPVARVVRLSNVVGDDAGAGTFLPQVARESLTGNVVVEQALDSAKDYVLLEDVLEVLVRVAEGRERLYNVASGVQTTHGQILSRLSELTGCTFAARSGAPTVALPPVDTARIRAEFGFRPRPLLEALEGLVHRLRGAP